MSRVLIFVCDTETMTFNRCSTQLSVQQIVFLLLFICIQCPRTMYDEILYAEQQYI